MGQDIGKTFSCFFIEKGIFDGYFATTKVQRINLKKIKYYFFPLIVSVNLAIPLVTDGEMAKLMRTMKRKKTQQNYEILAISF